MSLPDEDRAAIRAEFVREVPERIGRNKSGLEQLEAATSDAGRVDAINRLEHEAHNLRGAAATTGLDRIEQLATQLQVVLTRLQESHSGTGAEEASRIVRGVLGLLEEVTVGNSEVAARLDQARESGPVAVHIEDNLQNLRLVARILARRPHIRLVEAQTGEDGLELASALRPALVLLDLRLPDISGEEVLRRLRSNPATRMLRVVVISAEARPAETARLIDLGADEYLVKPIEIEMLLEIVDRVRQEAER